MLSITMYYVVYSVENTEIVLICLFTLIILPARGCCIIESRDETRNHSLVLSINPLSHELFSRNL